MIFLLISHVVFGTWLICICINEISFAYPEHLVHEGITLPLHPPRSPCSPSPAIPSHHLHLPSGPWLDTTPCSPSPSLSAQPPCFSPPLAERGRGDGEVREGTWGKRLGERGGESREGGRGRGPQGEGERQGKGRGRGHGEE